MRDFNCKINILTSIKIVFWRNELVGVVFKGVVFNSEVARSKLLIVVIQGYVAVIVFVVF